MNSERIDHKEKLRELLEGQHYYTKKWSFGPVHAALGVIEAIENLTKAVKALTATPESRDPADVQVILPHKTKTVRRKKKAKTKAKARTTRR